MLTSRHFNILDHFIGSPIQSDPRLDFCYFFDFDKNGRNDPLNEEGALAGSE
jgi:hypothetical protein